MNTILLVDDEEKLRGLIARIIRLEDTAFTTIEAGSIREALALLAVQEVDVVLCDVKLPDGNGVELIQEIKSRQPHAEVILFTAFGNIPDGVKAIKNGAYDYITKGDDHNKIIPLIYKAIEKVELSRRVQQLERQIGQRYTFDQVIGRSAAMLEAVNLGKKVAPSDTSVLLLGETGTGKEVFAQAIHYESRRKNKPFVAINCAAFSKELLESELFGHKAGAFTGAVKDKKGLFEEAHLGTLFLDEIGEMPVDLQSKLLRVLESGEFLKIGETKTRKADVRIISATNRDFSKEIEQGAFRTDLYYRLSVFTITMPPLRERREDVPLLTQYFADFYATKTGKKKLIPTGRYLNILEQNNWRGNVRELKNIIERSAILAEGEFLDLDTLPAELLDSSVSSGKVLSAFSLSSAEKLHIQKVLNHTKGNKAEAARLLEIGIATLYRKIEEFGL